MIHCGLRKYSRYSCSSDSRSSSLACSNARTRFARSRVPAPSSRRSYHSVSAAARSPPSSGSSAATFAAGRSARCGCRRTCRARIRIVLKERIRPGGSLSCRIRRVRHGRRAGAVDRGAARRIGDRHAVAERYCHEFHIGRFATQPEQAPENSVRLFRTGCLLPFLSAWDSVFRQAHGVIPKRLLSILLRSGA